MESDRQVVCCLVLPTLGEWDASGHKRPGDEVLQDLMYGDSTGSSIADKGMRTAGVNFSGAAACV